MSGTSRVKVAIIGSGNIGTDLMMKVQQGARYVEMGAMVGIDPGSEGLARARDLGVVTTHEGVEGLIGLPGFGEIDIVFDATSARAHVHNDALLRPLGKRLIDLTPAAVGPYVIPAVNLEDHLDAPNVNMVTCGGQATIPVVAAISRVVPVEYAEIVASISSRSAGPGTRANIDEFTETTSAAITAVGGARRGKAIIILNPAEPPLMMRDTVFALVSAPNTTGTTSHEEIRASVAASVAASVGAMVAEVAAYVPGYRLVQEVQVVEIPPDQPVETLLAPGAARPTHQVSVFLQVTGAGHYLPAYAGNLDIMTSAGLQVAERIAQRITAGGAGAGVGAGVGAGIAGGVGSGDGEVVL